MDLFAADIYSCQEPSGDRTDFVVAFAHEESFGGVLVDNELR